MTKSMASTGIAGNRICGHCMDWTREEKTFYFGCCENAQSDHYGHLLLTRHPACECYCKRRIEGD